jgi:hypothetical protein
MKEELTQEEILKKYPRLVSHMIAESLGYFTPRSAANAIIHAKLQLPFFCEMYCHFARHAKDFDAEVLEITRAYPFQAFAQRRTHTGYMAEYKLARRIVKNALRGNDPVFASWF